MNFMRDCTFCKIIKKELSAEFIYEDEEIIGIKSIQPEAPIHLLFIPKKHIEWKDKLRKDEIALLGKLILAAKKVALEQKIFKACKFIFNVGKTGHISHVHLHLIGGWKKKIPMKNV